MGLCWLNLFMCGFATAGAISMAMRKRFGAALLDVFLAVVNLALAIALSGRAA